MNQAIIYIIEFVVAFTLVYLLYRLFIIKKNKNKTKMKPPVELSLFIKMNNINLRKINKDKVMNNLALINAALVALILLLTEVTDSIALKIAIAFVSVFVLMLASYKLYGLYYKKKGMTKNVQS